MKYALIIKTRLAFGEEEVVYCFACRKHWWNKWKAPETSIGSDYVKLSPNIWEWYFDTTEEKASRNLKEKLCKKDYPKYQLIKKETL